MPDCIYKKLEKKGETFTFTSCKANKEGEKLSAPEATFKMTEIYERMTGAQNSNQITGPIKVLALSYEGHATVSTELSHAHYEILGSEYAHKKYIVQNAPMGTNLEELVNAQAINALQLNEAEATAFREQKAIDLDDAVFGFMYEAVEKGTQIQRPVSFIEQSSDCEAIADLQITGSTSEEPLE